MSTETKHWPVMSPEERSAWAAEKVMGWVRAKGAGFHSFRDWWKGDDQRRCVINWNPATDVADDYELMNHIRENQQDIMDEFENRLHDIWCDRHAIDYKHSDKVHWGCPFMNLAIIPWRHI